MVAVLKPLIIKILKMKKTIVFIKKQKSEIPCMASNAALRSCNASDFFFAKVKTVCGEESISLVSYDFVSAKWRSLKSGFLEVIEYYLLNEKFDNWMHLDGQNIDTFFDIFNCMDDEDK
jgi:hypothetical protein